MVVSIFILFILKNLLPNIAEDENLRVAKADPTLHKWKQKRPLIPDQPYIKTHFTDQSYSFIPPAIVHPGNTQKTFNQNPCLLFMLKNLIHKILFL